MSALVQCMNLTKCYVKGKAPAVSDLNLTIERGHRRAAWTQRKW